MGDFAAPALLILTLAALAWFQRNDVKNFEAFALIEDSVRRQRTFLKWAAQSCAFYLGVPLVGLALLGRLDAFWALPPEFYPVAVYVPPIGFEAFGPLLLGMGLGLAIVAVGFVVRRLFPRKAEAKPPREFKISPLFARNRAEGLRQIPLILNAGVSEEIFSRLYIPLLMVLCGLDALLAFIATTLLFGLLHRYQGMVGVIITTVLGAVFAFLYLAAGSLWLPILLHLVINSNSLLLRPAIKRYTTPRTD